MYQSMSRNGKNSSSMLQSPPKYFISIEIEISAIVVSSTQQHKLSGKENLILMIGSTLTFIWQAVNTKV
jgi:hypothetical protein